MKEYLPITKHNPKVLLKGVGVWTGNAEIIKDIIDRLKLKNNLALDLGVFLGFSSSVLSNYFEIVIGVDVFERHGQANDETFCENQMSYVQYMLKGDGFKNVQLVRSRAEDYIKTTNKYFDLIHIDLSHSYEETMTVGSWSIEHSDCVLFHDTIAIEPVMRACLKLEEKYKIHFYNFNYLAGLGIMTYKMF